MALKNLSKKFGTVIAVDDVTIEISRGELVTLLGPSGCGKTTILRMISGLIQPSRGMIEIFGRDVTQLETWDRNCGFVFQSYALFPHMNVFENIAYGLKIRKWSKDRIRQKMDEISNLLQIDELLQRNPKELSGGQQQRVAIARALSIEPDLLLMDEPLANLDAKLREVIRFELRRIQQETGITTIYVTHDQSEAFAMSDRIVVLSEGKVEQIGTPQEIFTTPASEFVASFIGNNNLLYGTISSIEYDEAQVDWGEFLFKGRMIKNLQPGINAVVSIRAEDFELLEKLNSITPINKYPEPNIIVGKISGMIYLGNVYRLNLYTNSGNIFVELPVIDTKEYKLDQEDNIKLRAINVQIIDMKNKNDR